MSASMLALAMLTTAFAESGPQPESKDGERTYSGFGGVGLGVVNYASGSVFANGSGATGAMRVLQSDFMFRVKESSWFVGYGLGIQGGSVFQRAFVPIDGFNEEADSVYGSCYSDVCFAINEIDYVDVLHVPIETNTAWTYDFWKMTLLVGGGPSIHYYKFRSYEAVSAFQLLDSGTSDLAGYGNGFMSSGQRSGDSEVNRKYAPGGQIFGGAMIELGQIPGIGGRWGLSLSAKGQWVRTTSYVVKQSIVLNEYWLDGTVDPAFSEKDSRQLHTAVNGSSYSAKIGLVYFF